jgi:probable rRNA maturation factor
VLVKSNLQETPDLTGLTEIARKSLRVEGFEKPAELSILLTDDEEIHELNRQYRGIDRPTDVLSFSQIEGEDFTSSDESVQLGDIVISVETAQRQADARGRLLSEELELLVAHGVLHLLGYDDQTDEDAEIMEDHQSAILSRE